MAPNGEDELTVFVYDASGQLVAEYSTQIETESPKVSYLTTDHLGSPRIATDAGGGVISRRDFTAFGEEVVTAQRTSGTTGNGYDPPNVRQDYTGYQKDLESGLEFAQARYYNTRHGRFTSVDPLEASAAIRNPQTFNRYSYVLNSPYEFTDPLGLMAGGCSADRSKCNGGEAVGSAHIADAMTAHDQRLTNTLVALKATAAANTGGLDAAWSVINSTHNPSDFQVFDQNGKEYDNPNAGTVTAEAVVTSLVEGNGAAGQGKPKINKVNKTKTFGGKTADEAISNVKIPCDGKIKVGCTFAYIAFNASPPKKKGKGVVSSVTVSATITVTLPAWSGYSKASAAERSTWDAFVAKVKTHEDGHVAIAEQGAQTLLNSIPTSGSSTGGLKASQSAAYNTWYPVYRAQQRHYDTVHYDIDH